MRKLLILSLWILASTAFGQTKVQRVFLGAAFDEPVFLTHSGDGTNRIFVVEQDGLIKVFPNDSTLERSQIGTFLDLRGSMTRFHNEAGVLGLAFHPAYEDNGYFYVFYTIGGPNRIVISRFSVDPANPDRGDPESELVLLELEKPFLNHNAGMIQFGPRDGFLYASIGDGGDRLDGMLHPPDSFRNGQNLESLFSTIIRIDVDQTSGGRNYGIPQDNPFVGNSEGRREEIWAYGFRNPWRFSIDSLTNRLWVGDVGAKAWEEIDLVEPGDNFGWSQMEGASCFREAGCDTTGLKMPIVQRAQSGGCNSITGGYVYRGSRRPDLQGAYIYGDYCHGYLRMLRYEDGAVTEHSELLDTGIRISSFGIDERGELYVVNHSGNVYWFAPGGSPMGTETEIPGAAALEQNFPNPFSGATSIRYALEHASDVDLTVFDVLGRRVRTLASSLKPAGRHVIEWDATDDAGISVGRGVYLYTLRIGDWSSTRKMTIR